MKKVLKIAIPKNIVKHRSHEDYQFVCRVIHNGIPIENHRCCHVEIDSLAEELAAKHNCEISSLIPEDLVYGLEKINE